MKVKVGLGAIVTVLISAAVGLVAAGNAATGKSASSNAQGVKCFATVGGETAYEYTWPTPTPPSKPMKFYVLGVHEDDNGALSIRDVVKNDLSHLKNVTVKYFTAGGFQYPEKQLNQLDVAISDPKTTGIFLWMVSHKLVTPDVKKALAKHIYVVGFLDNITDPSVLSNKYYLNNIYDSTTHIARVLMDKIIEKIGGKGQVATILGLAGSQTHSNFLMGSKQSVAAHPGVQLVAQKEYTGVDAAQTQTIAEALLRQNPHLKGILTILGQEANGVARAVDGAGLKGKVVVASWAMTGPSDLNAIKGGEYISEGWPVVQWSHTAAYDVVTAAEGKTVPKWVAPPAQFYTAADVGSMDFTGDLLAKYLGSYANNPPVCK